MDSQDIINQYRMALRFCVENESLFSVHDFLNALAVSGFKLCDLNDDEYDEEGVSLVSKAYMYSVVENIETSHHRNKEIDDFDSDIDDDLDIEDFYSVDPSDETEV